MAPWRAQWGPESHGHGGKTLTGWPWISSRKIGGCICVSPISAASQILSNYRIISQFLKINFLCNPKNCPCPVVSGNRPFCEWFFSCYVWDILSFFFFLNEPHQKTSRNNQEKPIFLPICVLIPSIHIATFAATLPSTLPAAALTAKLL